MQRHWCFRRQSRGSRICPSRASRVAASGGQKNFRAHQRLHSVPYSGGSLTERYPLESKFCPKQRQRCFRRPSGGFRICPSGASPVAASRGRKMFRALQRLHSIRYSGGSMTERYPLGSKFCPKQRPSCFSRPSRGFRMCPSIFFFFFFRTLLLYSFWTSRAHRCRPSSPPVLAFNFYRA